MAQYPNVSVGHGPQGTMSNCYYMQQQMCMPPQIHHQHHHQNLNQIQQQPQHHLTHHHHNQMHQQQMRQQVQMQRQMHQHQHQQLMTGMGLHTPVGHEMYNNPEQQYASQSHTPAPAPTPAPTPTPTPNPTPNPHVLYSSHMTSGPQEAYPPQGAYVPQGPYSPQLPYSPPQEYPNYSMDYRIMNEPVPMQGIRSEGHHQNMRGNMQDQRFVQGIPNHQQPKPNTDTRQQSQFNHNLSTGVTETHQTVRTDCKVDNNVPGQEILYADTGAGVEPMGPHDDYDVDRRILHAVLGTYLSTDCTDELTASAASQDTPPPSPQTQPLAVHAQCVAAPKTEEFNKTEAAEQMPEEQIETGSTTEELRTDVTNCQINKEEQTESTDLTAESSEEHKSDELPESPSDLVFSGVTPKPIRQRRLTGVDETLRGDDSPLSEVEEIRKVLNNPAWIVMYKILLRLARAGASVNVPRLPKTLTYYQQKLGLRLQFSFQDVLKNEVVLKHLKMRGLRIQTLDVDGGDGALVRRLCLQELMYQSVPLSLKARKLKAFLDDDIDFDPPFRQQKNVKVEQVAVENTTTSVQEKCLGLNQSKQSYKECSNTGISSSSEPLYQSGSNLDVRSNRPSSSKESSSLGTFGDQSAKRNLEEKMGESEHNKPAKRNRQSESEPLRNDQQGTVSNTTWNNTSGFQESTAFLAGTECRPNNNAHLLGTQTPTNLQSTALNSLPCTSTSASPSSVYTTTSTANSSGAFIPGSMMSTSRNADLSSQEILDLCSSSGVDFHSRQSESSKAFPFDILSEDDMTELLGTMHTTQDSTTNSYGPDDDLDLIPSDGITAQQSTREVGSSNLSDDCDYSYPLEEKPSTSRRDPVLSSLIVPRPVSAVVKVEDSDSVPCEGTDINAEIESTYPLDFPSTSKECSSPEDDSLSRIRRGLPRASKAPYYAPPPYKSPSERAKALTRIGKQALMDASLRLPQQEEARLEQSLWLSRKPKRDSYGCLKHTAGHNATRFHLFMEARRKWLRDAFDSREPVDQATLMRYIDKSFYLQRKELGISSKSIKAKVARWPLVFEVTGTMIHIGRQTGRSTLESWEKMKTSSFRPVIDALAKVDNERIRAIFAQVEEAKSNELNSDSDRVYVLALMPLLLEYFNESTELYYTMVPENSTSRQAVAGVRAPTPILVVLGDNLFTARKSYVVVEYQVTSCMNPLDGFISVFAMYYMLNLRYAQGCQATLEFIQRYFFGILPESDDTAPEAQMSPQVDALLRLIEARD